MPTIKQRIKELEIQKSFTCLTKEQYIDIGRAAQGAALIPGRSNANTEHPKRENLANQKHSDPMVDLYFKLFIKDI